MCVFAVASRKREPCSALRRTSRRLFQSPDLG